MATKYLNGNPILLTKNCGGNYDIEINGRRFNVIKAFWITGRDKWIVRALFNQHLVSDPLPTFGTALLFCNECA